MLQTFVSASASPPLPLHQCLCIIVSASVCLSIFVWCLCLCLFVYLCLPLSASMYLHQCLCLRLCAWICLCISVSASVCLSIFVCLCLHRCPFLCLTNIRDTFQSPGPPHTHCQQNEGCVQEKERWQTSIWQRPGERSRERPRQRTRQRPCMTGSLRHGISTRAGPQVERDNGLRGSALYALLLHVSNGSRGLHCVEQVFIQNHRCDTDSIAAATCEVAQHTHAHMRTHAHLRSRTTHMRTHAHMRFYSARTLMRYLIQ